jgi:hypothetical protein
MCECQAADFRASARGSGPERTLEVTGACTCPQSGVRLTLEFDNPGIVPHPEDVVLRLVVAAPQAGADVLTQTPVKTLRARVGPVPKRVEIRLPDAPGLSIPIIDS